MVVLKATLKGAKKVGGTDVCGDDFKEQPYKGAWWAGADRSLLTSALLYTIYVTLSNLFDLLGFYLPHLQNWNDLRCLTEVMYGDCIISDLNTWHSGAK